MNAWLAITHAEVVLEREVLNNATVLINNGLIHEIGPAEYLKVYRIPTIDAAGAYLIPGLIDTHNDGVEREINPRPRTNFPSQFAFRNFENRAVASGITTAFHAVMFADLLEKARSIARAKEVADMVLAAANSVIDHKVLYRLDVWTPEAMDPVFDSMRRGTVQAMSLNDHTPGQGQYRNVEEYQKTMAAYLAKGAIKIKPEEIAKARLEDHVGDRSSVKIVMDRTREEMRHEPFVLLAHDPDTAEKVDEMAEFGVTIAEFPVTKEAAVQARKRGMSITMGAPNIVRGGSASGNISAVELAAEGLLDIICGDYHAPSILYSTLKLVESGLCDFPKAVSMLGSNAAHAFGLVDTGRIRIGHVADLCLFRVVEGLPSVQAVIKNGDVEFGNGALEGKAPFTAPRKTRPMDR